MDGKCGPYGQAENTLDKLQRQPSRPLEVSQMLEDMMQVKRSMSVTEMHNQCVRAWNSSPSVPDYV